MFHRWAATNDRGSLFYFKLDGTLSRHIDDVSSTPSRLSNADRAIRAAKGSPSEVAPNWIQDHLME